MSRLHHANLLIGRPEDAEAYLRKFSEEIGVKVANNPDFLVFRTKNFGINEARELANLSLRKSVGSNKGGSKKIFLILASRITPEAQNALLKTFEDPTPGTHFFLSLREESQVLPTLRSRMQVIRVPRHTRPVLSEAEKFVSLPMKGRLAFAKSFVDEEKDLPDFLNDLMLVLERDSKIELLKKVFEMSRYAQDPAASSRLILEHLALVLPG